MSPVSRAINEMRVDWCYMTCGQSELSIGWCQDKLLDAQCRGERETMERLKVSQDQARTKRLLVEYLTNREQGWQLIVEGLRADDADKLVRAGQKELDAEKVAAQLRGR